MMPSEGVILDHAGGGNTHLNTFGRVDPNIALGVFSARLVDYRKNDSKNNVGYSSEANGRNSGYNQYNKGHTNHSNRQSRSK